MEKRSLNPTYIRAWREYRGFSLDRLIDRLPEGDNGKPFITKTSLSRIERALQPYAQPLLEVLAEALQCTPADLIMRNPQDTEAPWSIWEKLKPAEKEHAIELLKAVEKTSNKAA